jgi:hypothetical protein
MIQDKDSINIIKIAILAEEPLFWGSRKYYHKIILDDYSWEAAGNKYKFIASFVYDKDITDGKLNDSDFDVLIIPGGGVGNNEALLKGFTFLPKVQKFKRNIIKYVKNGGGVIGICGGAALITNLSVGDGRKPTSIIERLYDKSSLNISCVSSYFRSLAFPLLYPFQKNHPEHVGSSAYAFSFAPGNTEDGKKIMTTGCPIDIQIDKNNPIFINYSDDIRRIRWWAGQALIPPEKTDRIFQVLARFPSEDISENSNLHVNAWRYIGGIHGIVRGIIRAANFIKNNDLRLSYLPLLTYYLTCDWDYTDTPIEMDLGNRPCMTAEIYPNENAGRIILSTVHAEYSIWWGGHIEKNDNESPNCIGSGLYQWKDIDSPSESMQKELTYNWWILRRMVAWCAKVKDEQLPPKELGEINQIVKQNIIQKLFWDGTKIHQYKSI